MKEMADSEEQMHVPINPSAWEQQNGKYSGMAGRRLQLIDIIGPAQSKLVVVFLFVCFC